MEIMLIACLVLVGLLAAVLTICTPLSKIETKHEKDLKKFISKKL